MNKRRHRILNDASRKITDQQVNLCSKMDCTARRIYPLLRSIVSLIIRHVFPVKFSVFTLKYLKSLAMIALN